MALARQGWWLGMLAAGLAGTGVPAGSQTATQQQQQVPDAPKPQALPSLKTITPVGPASSSTAADTPDAPTPTPAAQVPATPQPTPAAQEDADQGPPPVAHASQVHVTVQLVEIPFTVKDSHGTLVPGLKPRDIRVFENGVKQNLLLFTDDATPLSVALVIDQSVPFQLMTTINNSLAALQGAFTNYDAVAVFTYNNGVKEQTKLTGAQSARLTAALEYSKAKGREPVMPLGGPMAQTTMINNKSMDPNTQPVGMRNGEAFEKPEKEFHTLNDAILAAAQSLNGVDRTRRKIVYVISDGKEYGSKATEKEVIKYCQGNNIQVYATLVGDSAVPVIGFLDRIHLPFTMRDNALPRYVAQTGGQMDLEIRQGGIEKSFARIAEESRTQYMVGYYTKASPLDEHFRKVEVQVLRPSLQIVAPPGYYATPANSRPPVVPVADTSAPKANP